MAEYKTTAPLLPTDGTHEFRSKHGRYLPHESLLHAANTALCLGRPLLLTGEPGCGKSDFANVVAHALGRGEVLRCQVRSDSTARDLLYHYDSLLRFRDAQFGDRERSGEPRHYVTLQPLGVAMVSPRPRVVLIDEIDKAPRDLPNDLLLELDEGYFEIPELRGLGPDPRFTDPGYPEIALAHRMAPPHDAVRPFVVITSNAERQLPEPFLRRCVFFHVPPLDHTRLLAIAKARFEAKAEPRLLASLTDIFVALRDHAQHTKRPSTSEMLDWMTLMLHHYDRDFVTGVVEAFASAITADGQDRRLDVDAQPWAGLPGLGSLVKLGEDFGKLGVEIE